MRFHKQRFRHSPKNGVYGDCWRTAIACLLDVEPEDVPHWAEGPNDHANHPAEEWLGERGLCVINVAYDMEMSMEDALNASSVFHHGLNYLFSGTSRTGCDHVVIARDGRIIHDPSQTESGIVGPSSSGCWWASYIGKIV